MKINIDEINVERDKDEEKVFIVSFPKSGRTWLRVLLSRYKQNLLGIDEFYIKLHAMFAEGPIASPQFIFYHGRSSVVEGEIPSRARKIVQALVPSKRNVEYPFDLSYCRGSKIVFLVRDPRDTIVSYFHQATSRSRIYKGSLSEFIRDPLFGVQRLLGFLNFLAENSHAIEHHIVHYEDLHTNTLGELSAVLQFADVDVNREHIREAIKFAKFENMKKMEQEESQGHKLSPKDKDDPNSFKVRKGKIGSFLDELSESDIEYLEEQIDEHLPSMFSRYGQAS